MAGMRRRIGMQTTTKGSARYLLAGLANICALHTYDYMDGCIFTPKPVETCSHLIHSKPMMRVDQQKERSRKKEEKKLPLSVIHDFEGMLIFDFFVV